MNENASVPTSRASTALSIRSRYQIRMYLAEKVPVAICTTSTVTVTTNPVSAALAPTIVVSNVLAVDDEYVSASGSDRLLSISSMPDPASTPVTPPANGSTHRLPRMYCWMRKRRGPAHRSPCSRRHISA